MLDLNDLATWRPRPQEPFSGHTLSCWRIARSDPVPFLDARTAAPALPGRQNSGSPIPCAVAWTRHFSGFKQHATFGTGMYTQ